MTAKEIFELRKQGRWEEAYEAARALYAEDKGLYACSAMFWTAIDMLRERANEDRIEEAHKIYLALQRLSKVMDDDKGWIRDAMKNCDMLLHKGISRKNLVDNGPEHLQIGVWGEELAASFLREKGFVILQLDWRSKHRDIDIIAQDGDCLVFVEVKTRRNCDYADPLSAVDYKKLKNLRLAINHYVKYHHIDNPFRFDVITIVGTPNGGTPEINHIEDFRIF
jgi:uncharacterized protein (TIGR00252 family)